MAQQDGTDLMDSTAEKFGRVAYEGYCAAADGRSLVSGEGLPRWDDLDGKIKAAWAAAGTRAGELALALADEAR